MTYPKHHFCQEWSFGFYFFARDKNFWNSVDGQSEFTKGVIMVFDFFLDKGFKGNPMLPLHSYDIPFKILAPSTREFLVRNGFNTNNVTIWLGFPDDDKKDEFDDKFKTFLIQKNFKENVFAASHGKIEFIVDLLEQFEVAQQVMERRSKKSYSLFSVGGKKNDEEKS